MKKILLLLFLIFIPIITYAECPSLPPGSVQDTADGVCIDNPIKADSPEKLIGQIIKTVLGISGSLALLMFIYGGFTWMLSGGNAEKVTKGKNTLVWASIGLIVIFSSYAMVNTVLKGLGGT